MSIEHLSIAMQNDHSASYSKALLTLAFRLTCISSEKSRTARTIEIWKSFSLTSLLAWCVVGAFSGLQPAYAQFDSSASSTDNPLKVFSLFASGAVTSDSNLFRRPDALAQSDTFATAKLGVRLDKPFGQQQIKLEVSQTTTKYEKFKYLDFDAVNYNGVWNWHFSPRITGKLSAARTESLAPYEDTLGTQRNVRISQNQAFDLDASVFGGWHLLLGATQIDQKSEQSALINRTPDFQSTASFAGIKYQSKAGNAITARWQNTDGKYINNPVASLNSDYTESLGELITDWRANASSSFNLRLGWIERINSDPSRSNFSGPSTSLSYSWYSGGKLSFSLSASQKTSPVQSVGVSHKEDNSITVTPTWKISEKTNTYITLNYLTSKDQASGTAIVAPLRHDITSNATLGFNWMATQKISVNARLQQIRRTSNTVFANYETSIANVSATLTF